MPTIAKVFLIIIGILVILTGLLFVIYFFNLDMKLMAKLSPIFDKHYDKIAESKKRGL